MKPAVLTVPRFVQIPFLIHGFGNGAWTAKSFGQREEWRDFAPVFLRQVHSDVVHFVAETPGKSLKGDAMITRRGGVFLIIKTADCLPVLLVDEEKRVVAAAHCGWKGTCLRLLRKVVRSMTEFAGSDPSRLLVALGPCIGRRCYEVGEDVRERFLESAFPDSLFRPHLAHRGKYVFDLREANRLQLVESGVPARRVFSIDVCTHCDRTFPSYRRDKDRTGRMLSFIGLSRAKRGDLHDEVPRSSGRPKGVGCNLSSFSLFLT